MPSLHLRGQTPETLARAFPGLDLTFDGIPLLAGLGTPVQATPGEGTP